jgi:hypothetical protein
MASTALVGGALALGLSAAQVPGQGEGATTPSAVMTAPTAITVTPDAIDCIEFTSPQTCRTTVFVRGGTTTPRRDVRLGAILARGDGEDIEVKVMTECLAGCSGNVIHIDHEPGQAVRVTLELPQGWRNVLWPHVASGFIGVVNDAQRFEAAPKRLRVLAPSPSYWQWLVVLVPGCLALVEVAAVARRLRAKDITLDHRMGSPSWKASESWSSNLTVGGALVNGVLSLALVSELTVFMTKASYTVLTMLLAAFALLAPLAYGISRRRVVGKEPAASVVTAQNILVPQPDAVDEFEGTVRVFLLAGALTLWASGGQLVTFALLIVEVWRFGALSGPLATIVVALSFFVLAGLLQHGFTSMLEFGLQAKAEREETRPNREGIVVRRQAPTWKLL